MQYFKRSSLRRSIQNTIPGYNVSIQQVKKPDPSGKYPVGINFEKEENEIVKWASMRLNFTTRGTIGKAVTWQYHYKVQDFIWYLYRSNPPPITEAVAHTRDRLRRAMAEWADLTSSAKWYWKQKAKNRLMHGVNLYVQSKLKNPDY